MSAVDAYLLELRASLGSRLPPSVHEARLREARGHLLASAEDVGETEAVRRYGRARAVADGLVRAYRGYATQGSWWLALPLSASFFILGAASTLLIAFHPLGVISEVFVGYARSLFPLVLLGFCVRVAQTRRWLVAPMLVSHVMLSLVLVALLGRTEMPSGLVGPLGEAEFVAMNLVGLGASWAALNALALVAGSLFDLRRVPRALETR